MNGLATIKTYDADRGAQRSIPAGKNRLTNVTGTASATSAFVYDGDGNRVKSTINTTIPVTTAFIGNHTEWDVASSSLTRYYYAGATRVAMRKNNTIYYLLGDHLGSTSVTTDQNGQNLGKQYYLPWGEVRYSSSSPQTKYTYTGQYSNVSDFGLMYYNARWYDSALGRFTSADTIVPQPGNPLDWDRYGYTRNNPINYSDPSGHFTEDAIYDYLMGYYDGDDESVRRRIHLWKQDQEWWKIISTAEGGNDLTGYFWRVTGNPNRPTGGDSKFFSTQFIGQGQNILEGVAGYDLVRLQTRQYDGWGVVYKEPNFGPTVLFGLGLSTGLSSFLDGGIELLISNAEPDGNLAIYSYSGQGNGSGESGNGSVYFGSVWGLNNPFDYIGHSTSKALTISLLKVGFTAAYFYNDSGNITGWYVGYAPGASVSITEWNNYYNLLWSSTY